MNEGVSCWYTELGLCVWQGTPAVMETYVDSKKEVDSHLKKTCEEFIHSITQMFIGPLTDFLTKVDVMSFYVSCVTWCHVMSSQEDVW